MATLGVTVPDAVVPQLMAALRAQYPDLTGDAPGMTPLADGPAVKAVIKLWMRQAVKHRAESQVKAGQENAVTAAGAQAWNDLAGIT